MSVLTDPRFRAPRLWSNQELKKIAPLLSGDIVNVSGWRDSDKEGKTYQLHYFTAASDYFITNWKSDARGYQGDLKNEFYLDLEKDLPKELVGRFDVVFNHTTLEHVFDMFKAFENLCSLSKDVVVVVVPFLQEQHGSYGDYWRFTPWAIKRLFQRNGLMLAYLNFNDTKKDAIYVFAVGARNQDSVDKLSSVVGNRSNEVENQGLGRKLIASKSSARGILLFLKRMMRI